MAEQDVVMDKFFQDLLDLSIQLIESEAKSDHEYDIGYKDALNNCGERINALFRAAFLDMEDDEDIIRH